MACLLSRALFCTCLVISSSGDTAGQAWAIVQLVMHPIAHILLVQALRVRSVIGQFVLVSHTFCRISWLKCHKSPRFPLVQYR